MTLTDDARRPTPVEDHLRPGALFRTGFGKIIELDGLHAIGRASYHEWGTGATGIIPVDTMKDLWTTVDYIRLHLDVGTHFPDYPTSTHPAIINLWTMCVQNAASRYLLDVECIWGTDALQGEYGPQEVRTAIWQTSLDDLSTHLTI